MRLEKVAWFILTVVSFIFVFKCVLLKGGDLDDLFINGDSVYESVDYIDRNIEFLPERYGEDVWQSPSHTMAIKTGDCEDALLLFAYLNRGVSVPAYYCFGDIRDASGDIQTHAWVELSSNSGEMYVVEFFSHSTSDSFIRITEDKWERVRHLVLSHDVFCEMAKNKFKRQNYVISKLHNTFNSR